MQSMIMTFLVVGYVQETIDGDYGRKNRVVVRANFIVYVRKLYARKIARKQNRKHNSK